MSELLKIQILKLNLDREIETFQRGSKYYVACPFPKCRDMNPPKAYKVIVTQTEGQKRQRTDCNIQPLQRHLTLKHDLRFSPKRKTWANL